MPDAALSDKALSILVFAAYHSLTSGEKVRDVVLDDGMGHHADTDGVEEVRNAGLLEIDGNRGRLTEKGEERLAGILERIRTST